MFDAVLRDLGIQFGAQCGIGLRQRTQAFAQCLEVQHGAADQQRNLAARGDVGHQAQCIVAEGGGGIGLGRGDDVDQVVRCAGEGGGIRLGGADVHVAEHQRGIDADELHRQALHQFHGDAGLAAGGGAHEENWPEEVFSCESELRSTLLPPLQFRRGRAWGGVEAWVHLKILPPSWPSPCKGEGM